MRHALSGPGDDPSPYLDFSLRLEPYQEGEGFPVTVIHSPAGEGRGTLDLGNGPEALLAFRREFLQLVGDREENPELPPLPRVPRELRQRAQELGRRLFDALFQGEVRSLYDRSWGMARPARGEAPPARGLRLRLHLEPRHPQLQALCSLPWELLYSPADRSFLCLDPSTPVVRHLDLPTPPLAGALRRPLTILVALSSPSGVPGLNVNLERERIERTWSLRDEVHLIVLERATLSALREAVRRQPVHAFHFVGHAAFDPGSGEGVLLFETAGGRPELVSGRQLVPALRGAQTPHVVFLNACHTARQAEREGANPLGGAAVSLLANGVPAVVAMQSGVGDKSAITFGESFYRSLARGGSLEEAVTEGRNQVFTFPRPLDWATPVLFLRTPNGDLFGLERAGPIIWPPGPGPEAPRAPAGTKVLPTFQKDIYRLFDDIGLCDMPAYKRLRLEEKRIVQHEVIRRMAGLGVQPQDLLDVGHLNARFSAFDLLRDQGVRSGRGELQRKSALFSSHSLATIPSEWTLPETDEDERVRGTFDENALQLLLDHRPLVEAGKMCVVPRLVYQAGRGYEPRCLFAVKDLRTVGVDLKDGWARSALTRQGKLFQAAVVLDVSAGGLLPLGDILEIEERYQAEYDHFQTHLRSALESMHRGGEDYTKALELTLKEVDQGIQDLEGRYQAILQKRRDMAGRIGAGGLAILLYGLGASELAFLVSAFAASALSGGIRLVRQLEEIPAEIRASPLFVPWLIQRRGG